MYMYQFSTLLMYILLCVKKRTSFRAPTVNTWGAAVTPPEKGPTFTFSVCFVYAVLCFVTSSITKIGAADPHNNRIVVDRCATGL